MIKLKVIEEDTEVEKKFTFHIVMIKRDFKYCLILSIIRFTFHIVKIKQLPLKSLFPSIFKFTFHLVKIKLLFGHVLEALNRYLHST